MSRSTDAGPAGFALGVLLWVTHDQLSSTDLPGIIVAGLLTWLTLIALRWLASWQ